MQRYAMRRACLVVNGFVEILDENIALASLAESRIALRPHDPADKTIESTSSAQRGQAIPCTVFNQRVIELLKSAFA